MMATLILVATSTKGFGELIQQTLEDTGRYQVLLVDSVEDAIDCTQRMLFPVCILDSAIRGGTIKELATELNLDSSEIITRLANSKINIAENDTVKQSAGKNGLQPIELLKVILIPGYSPK